MDNLTKIAGGYFNSLLTPPDRLGNLVFFSFGRKGPTEHHFAQHVSAKYKEICISSEISILKIAHTESATVKEFHDQHGRFSGIIWGIAHDRQTGSEEVAIENCIRAIEKKSYDILNDIAGLFVFIILDRHENKLYIINDYIGARPFFIYMNNGIMNGSSHALALANILPRPLKPNYDAVSEYLIFTINVSRNSLVEGINRPRAGSVTSTYAGSDVVEEVKYNTVTATLPAMGTDDMASLASEIVERSNRNWLKHSSKLAYGLSGGYDSRLLCALSLGNQDASKLYINIRNLPSETVMAQKVAELLGIPLEVLEFSEDWYLPESRHHITADGFPISKGLGRLILRHAPDHRIVDGYLGDALLRGHLDHIIPSSLNEKDNDETINTILNRMAGSTMPLLKKHIRRNVIKRAFTGASNTVKEYNTGCHAVTSFDLFIRQARLISRNFLQNIDACEPCLPFYDPELIRLKRAYPYADFTIDTYQAVYKRLAPQLAGMPHNSQLDTAPPKDHISRNDKKWIRDALIKSISATQRQYLDTSYTISGLLLNFYSPKWSHIMVRLRNIWNVLAICEANAIHFDWKELELNI